MPNAGIPMHIWQSGNTHLRTSFGGDESDHRQQFGGDESDHRQQFGGQKIIHMPNCCRWLISGRKCRGRELSSPRQTSADDRSSARQTMSSDECSLTVTLNNNRYGWCYLPITDPRTFLLRCLHFEDVYSVLCRHHGNVIPKLVQSHPNTWYKS